MKVLLIEDNILIGMDAEMMLYDAGAEQVDARTTAAEGLDLLKSFNPDFAVLDINLGTGTSLPVAEALLARQVPFIFATGYGDTSMLPTAMADMPVLQKPYEEKALRHAVAIALANAKSQTATP